MTRPHAAGRLDPRGSTLVEGRELVCGLAQDRVLRAFAGGRTVGFRSAHAKREENRVLEEAAAPVCGPATDARAEFRVGGSTDAVGRGDH
jgi:hypothetical protein